MTAESLATRPRTAGRWCRRHPSACRSSPRAHATATATRPSIRRRLRRLVPTVSDDRARTTSAGPGPRTALGALATDERGAAYLEAAAAARRHLRRRHGHQPAAGRPERRRLRRPRPRGLQRGPRPVPPRRRVRRSTGPSSTSACDVVETNTFGAFGVVLAEYGLAGPRRGDQPGRGPPGPGGRRRGRRPPRRPAPLGGREPRARAPSSRPSARSPTPTSATPTRSRPRRSSPAASTSSSSRRSSTSSRPRRPSTRAERAMVAAGRRVPIQVQVTIELTGRMLPGTEIGAALTALDAMRPDVIGLNCATGPAEMGEPLRHLSQHSRLPGLRPAQRRPALGGRRHDALRPDPGPAGRPSRALRHRARRDRRRRVLRHHPGPPPRRGRALPGPHARTPGTRNPSPAAAVHLQRTSPSTRTRRSSWSASGPTPTGRRSSARPCSRPTGTPPWPWPATRSRRAPTSSTSASTTPAPTASPT